MNFHSVNIHTIIRAVYYYMVYTGTNQRQITYVILRGETENEGPIVYTRNLKGRTKRKACCGLHSDSSHKDNQTRHPHSKHTMPAVTS